MIVKKSFIQGKKRYKAGEAFDPAGVDAQYLAHYQRQGMVEDGEPPKPARPRGRPRKPKETKPAAPSETK